MTLDGVAVMTAVDVDDATCFLTHFLDFGIWAISSYPYTLLGSSYALMEGLVTTSTFVS